MQSMQQHQGKASLPAALLGMLAGNMSFRPLTMSSTKMTPKQVESQAVLMVDAMCPSLIEQWLATLLVHYNQP